MKTYPNQCVLFAFLKHLHRSRLSLPLLLATFSTELVKSANHEIKRPVLQSINYNYYNRPFLSVITNFNLPQGANNDFDGFAPMQKPKTSPGLKGIDSSGSRKLESAVD